jgi:uroporphyrinogen III methyltransferase/synthase
VDIFFQELFNKGIDIRRLKGIKVGAIGPATFAQLAKRGIMADLVPEEYRAEGIIEELKIRVQTSDRILLPRAGGARTILPESLRELGANVDEVILYRASTASHTNMQLLEEVQNGQMDYITFTSSSTVNNFVKIIGAEFIENINKRVKVVCIGPITAQTAQENGFTVDVMPGQYTIEALFNSIVQDFKDYNKNH